MILQEFVNDFSVVQLLGFIGSLVVALAALFVFVKKSYKRRKMRF